MAWFTVMSCNRPVSGGDTGILFSNDLFNLAGKQQHMTLVLMFTLCTETRPSFVIQMIVFQASHYMTVYT